MEVLTDPNAAGIAFEGRAAIWATSDVGHHLGYGLVKIPNLRRFFFLRTGL